MGDLFTDTPDYTPIEDFPPEPEAVPEPTAVPPEVPETAKPEEGSSDASADVTGGTSGLAGEEASAGVEEVPPAIVQIDYTDILTQQLEQLEFLVEETKEISRQLDSISNVYPVICCLQGVIIGILLLKILASYIRP